MDPSGSLKLAEPSYTSVWDAASRNCRPITLMSIYAMLSQLPGLGVLCISSRSAMRRASARSKVSCSYDG